MNRSGTPRARSSDLPQSVIAAMDERGGRALLVVGLVLAGILPTLADGHILHDMTAYTQAAEHLVHGESLYASYQGDLTPYKYAPWFALLWVPLAYVPQPLLGTLWLGGSLWATSWLLWRAPWWLAIVAGPFVSWGAAVGNAAPLIFAALAGALPTRARSIVIGVAASLKAFPILLVLPLVAQRRWREAGIAIGVALLLTSPMLLFDLSSYQVGSEGPKSIFNVLGPLAWAIAAGSGVAIALLRPSWRSGGLAVLLANPRFQWYDLGYLLVGPQRSGAAQTKTEP